MTTHTPGPWTAFQKQEPTSGAKLPQWRIHGPGITGPIATVDFDLTQGTTKRQDENVEQNARLIAAAAELLEACKYVVRYHRDHDSGEGELFGLDFVTTCISAIRKAEGREL